MIANMVPKMEILDNIYYEVYSKEWVEYLGFFPENPHYWIYIFALFCWLEVLPNLKLAFE